MAIFAAEVEITEGGEFLGDGTEGLNFLEIRAGRLGLSF